MKRLGIVIDGTDHFIKPLLPALQARHQVSMFKPSFLRLPLIGSRVNEALLNLQLRAFLKQNDVVFFEWAVHLLNMATHFSGLGKIATRLHSFELATTAHLIDWAKVDAAIVVSEKMKNRLLEILPEPPKVLQVVNYGVNLQEFAMVERVFQYRLGMICRVVPIKRVYEIVLCLYELRQQGHPFTLQVLGKENGAGEEPRYYLAIQELVNRLGLQDAVCFHGHQDMVSPYYREMDIFLSNSFWEGQQNALLEAMASGCYCLSHCWGGVEEVLPAEQIYITDSDLQEKLLAYAALPEGEKVLAQQRMRTLAEEKFDQQRMVQQVIDIIEKV